MATTVLVIAADHFGPDFLTWHPTTVRMELEALIGARLAPTLLDKLMAAVTIITTNYFAKDVTKFIDICNILFGDELQTEEFNPADADEILWGVTEAMILNPVDDSDDDAFSPEVAEYVSQVLQQEGIHSPLDVLKVAFRRDITPRMPEMLAEDPEMFTAVYEVQQGKVTELIEELKARLQLLYTQLESVPLQSGDKTQFLERLKSAI